MGLRKTTTQKPRRSGVFVWANYLRLVVFFAFFATFFAFFFAAIFLCAIHQCTSASTNMYANYFIYNNYSTRSCVSKSHHQSRTIIGSCLVWKFFHTVYCDLLLLSRIQKSNTMLFRNKTVDNFFKKYFLKKNKITPSRNFLQAQHLFFISYYIFKKTKTPRIFL